MEDTGNQQPGQTITPTKPASNSTPQQSPGPSTETVRPLQPVKPEVQTPEKQPPAADEPVDPQLYKPDVPDTANTPNAQAITWTASEFIAHAKSFGWYTGLATVALVIAAMVFFITKGDVVSVGVIIFGAVLLGIYGGHQPRQLEYRLDANGLTIGKKHFEYQQFRSFSVLPEDAFSSIVFMPLGRFAVPTTIYYAPEDENKIVSLLADRLPFEERGHDAVDRLMQRIRF